MDTAVRVTDEQNFDYGKEKDKGKDDYKDDHKREEKHKHEHHDRHHHEHHDRHEHHYHGYKRDHDHYESRHVHELEKTIKGLGDALASFGRGSHLLELLRIVNRPGWTTPAELAFVNTILDSIAVQVRSLDRLQAELVEAARKVKSKHD